jgi:hypothetical protein
MQPTAACCSLLQPTAAVGCSSCSRLQPTAADCSHHAAYERCRRRSVLVQVDAGELADASACDAVMTSADSAQAALAQGGTAVLHRLSAGIDCHPYRDLHTNLAVIAVASCRSQ